MQKHLFFICPTDFLESVIEDAYACNSVYLTSLGNSFAFDPETVSEVNDLIQTKDITHISFILADDNRIISDALGQKAFSEITVLDKFYRNIERQKQHCEEVWPPNYHQFLISSYYLNHKIMQLRALLHENMKENIHMSGKIYKRQEQVFRDICSFSVVRDCVALN